MPEAREGGGVGRVRKKVLFLIWNSSLETMRTGIVLGIPPPPLLRRGSWTGSLFTSSPFTLTRVCTHAGAEKSGRWRDRPEPQKLRPELTPDDASV